MFKFVAQDEKEVHRLREEASVQPGRGGLDFLAPLVRCERVKKLWLWWEGCVAAVIRIK